MSVVHRAGPTLAKSAEHASLEAMLQLLQYRRILERRHVLCDLLAFCDRAQEPSHDLPGARLRQIVAEANVLRFGDRADLLADPVAQLLCDLLCVGARRPRLLEDDERAAHFAG